MKIHYGETKRKTTHNEWNISSLKGEWDKEKYFTNVMALSNNEWTVVEINEMIIFLRLLQITSRFVAHPKGDEPLYLCALFLVFIDCLAHHNIVKVLRKIVIT